MQRTEIVVPNWGIHASETRTESISDPNLDSCIFRACVQLHGMNALTYVWNLDTAECLESSKGTIDALIIIANIIVVIAILFN